MLKLCSTVDLNGLCHLCPFRIILKLSHTRKSRLLMEIELKICPSESGPGWSIYRIGPKTSHVSSSRTGAGPRTKNLMRGWKEVVLLVTIFQTSFAQFDKSECGKSKSCHIPDASSCPEECRGMGMSWRLIDDDNLEVELFVKSNSSTGKYVAVGFSDDDKMGNEPVIECSSLGDQPASMKFSFDKKKGKGNDRVKGDFTSYFTNSTTEFKDGIFYCKSNVKISGSADNSMVFKHDPTAKYHLLLVNGMTKDNGLMYHKGNQDAVTPKVSLSNKSYGAIPDDAVMDSPDFDISSAELQLDTFEVSPSLSLSTSKATPIGPFDSTGCGKTKGCTLPVGDSCYGAQGEGLGASYTFVSDNIFELEIFGPVNISSSENVYVAVGFSNHTKMNDISVIECSKLPGETNPTMKFSYNEGFENVRISGEEAIRKNLINLTTSSIQDSHIYCKGTVNVGGDVSNSQIFKWNHTQQYYLLFASGPTDASGLHHHTGDCTSPNQVFLDNVDPMFDSSQCGKSKACFAPTDCKEGCDDIQASWRIVDDQHLAVELTGKVDGLNTYVALGFSIDGQMSNASVIECSSFNNQSFSMTYSYNTVAGGHYTNVRSTSNVSNLVTDQRAVFADGILYCTATFKVTGDASDPAVFKFSPAQEYYLILATGVTRSNDTYESLAYHREKRSISPKQVLSQLAIPTTTPTPPSGDTTFDASTCGSTKACYTPSEGNTIAYSVDNTNDLVLEIYSTQTSSNGVYTAVGFGSTTQMSPASVVECSSLQGQPLSMKFSYNGNGPTNDRISGEEAIRSQLITNTETSFVDGKVYCKGTIKAGGNASNSEILNFNPSEKYYLLVAKGSTSSAGLTYHGPSDRWVSSQRLLSDTGAGNNSGGKSTTFLILHAVFMTVAWLVLVPIAVLFARVLRGSWPNTKPGGLLIWFQIHRAANIIAIALMIAAFVLILVYKDWNFTTTGWGGAHALTGVLALVLGWIQPIISVFRCGPADKLRPIFNITHRAIGVTALCLASTAIAIAGYHFTPSRHVVQLVLSLVPITILFGVSYFFLIFNSCLDKYNESDSTNRPSNRPNVVRVEPSSKSQSTTTWNLSPPSDSGRSSDSEVAQAKWPHRFREFVVFAAVLAFIAIGAVLATFFANAF